MVIAARNPVHSVLFLILAFFNAAGLFVLLGAEFLAMILVVVYVGAVAVLFLFVVMMLDIDFAELKRGALQYLPFGALIGLILVAELVMAGSVWVLKPARRPPARQRHAGRRHQHRGARAHPLYRLCLLLPDRRPGAAGGDDRRHRADPAPPPRRAPPVDPRCRTRAPPAMAVDMVDVKPGRGGVRWPSASVQLSDGRRDPLHHRRVRHLPEPQEHHHHPDVDRADPAGGQHQFRRLLGLSWAIWWGRSSRCSC